MIRISFYTLGCKLNQAETSFLSSDLIEKNFKIVPFGEKCDVCVINTCAVTARTEQKCRQVIRKARMISPQGRIAVIGCYAQMADEEIRKLPGVQLILGGDSKFDLLNFLSENQNKQIMNRSRNDVYRSAAHGDFREKTRAFVKIQDGCNNFCSYCIVPYLRGNSRSEKPENVYSNITELVKRGYQEVVFTGVHIGKYGEDLVPRHSLLTLLRKIVEIPGLGRIRLSSLEPVEVNSELINFIGENSKICPHFHIPLQSGDDFILNKMNRNYRANEFEEVIDLITKKIENPGIGIDVIAGFPGESEIQFKNTYEFINKLPVSYMHVFSFSSRPGTKAAEFKGIVPPDIKRERSRLLIELGKKKKNVFYNNCIGRRHEVVFEEKKNSKYIYGFTENYLRVRAAKDDRLLNRIVPVKVISVEDNLARVDFC